MPKQAKSDDELLKNVDYMIEKALKRCGSHKDKDYFRSILKDLIQNNSIPVELLQSLPVNAGEVGKTRFDQIFDAAMILAFPDYREETLKQFLGETFDKDMRVWRVVLPEKFNITHVFIRAKSYQDAFALACDYACRVSLRLYRKIPTDLTVRVMFITEKALRRHLGMRWANRVKKRKQLQLNGREFTAKQVNGARIAALGHFSNDSNRSIAKYAEVRDLVRVRQRAGLVKLSAVELETLKKP